MTREESRIVAYRVSPVPSQLFSERWEWNSPEPGGYASPAGSGLIFSGRGEITRLADDGTVRWVFRHDAWPEGGLGKGACTLTPSGEHVIATVCGAVGEDGSYEGDLCVALDSSSGELVARSVLPAFSALYEFQQSLSGSDHVFLSAGQGQDEFHSMLVTLRSGELSVLPAGAIDEPFTGNSLGGAFLKMARDGASLTRYQMEGPGTCRSAAVAWTESTLSSPDLRLVGRPGFVDEATVLAPVAEDWWPEESRHLLLNSRTLRLEAMVEYPFAVSPDPIALGDGTWLTVSNDQVYRWRAAK